jgi:hypothetical protein
MMQAALMLSAQGFVVREIAVISCLRFRRRTETDPADGPSPSPDIPLDHPSKLGPTPKELGERGEPAAG